MTRPALLALSCLLLGCDSAPPEDTLHTPLSLPYTSCPSEGVASLVPGAIPGQLVPGPCVPARAATFEPIAPVRIGEGLTYSSFPHPLADGASALIYLLEVDLSRAVLDVTRPAHRGQTTSEFGAAYRCDAAINASRFQHTCEDLCGDTFFDLWGWGLGGRSDEHHAGVSWAGHDQYRTEWYQPEPCGDHDSAYYFATVGGVAEIGKSFSGPAPPPGQRYTSGPDFPNADLLVTDWWRLVWDGEMVATRAHLDPRCEPNDHNNWARTARTAVGIRPDGRVVFVVAEMTEDSAGLTIPELGELMASPTIGAHRAIALDGGGSSAMFVRNTGLVNRPKASGPERAVATHIGMNCERAFARVSRRECEECE